MARLREQELICTQNTEVPCQRGHMTRPRQLAFVTALFRVEIARTSSTEESPTKKFGFQSKPWLHPWPRGKPPQGHRPEPGDLATH